MSILPDTMGRISEIENVIGLEDSGRGIRKTSDITERVGKKMNVMTGEPPMFLATLALSGTGGCSVHLLLLPNSVSKSITPLSKETSEVSKCPLPVDALDCSLRYGRKISYRVEKGPWR